MSNANKKSVYIAEKLDSLVLTVTPIRYKDGDSMVIYVGAC
jgi:hypothetical protein